MDILQELFALQDKEYALFQSKLTPNIPVEKFIGVRVPQVRKLAKVVAKDPASREFIASIPHQYYDENMLHASILSEEKNYDTCVTQIEAFLPYIDNWAVCDTLIPKAFKMHKDELIEKIKEWTASSHTYTCRFGMKMLMSFFLDEDFKEVYLEMPASVHSEEYYVNMMIAWFYATALAKQWDATIPYLENQRLDAWAHNKTIQKAKESFRITTEQKTYLNSLKRK